jgi:threonine dehydrogenase-like Zn-dependent dehydrogenase
MPLARVHGVDDLRVDQIEIPRIGPHDVLIRVGATGVCGSDLGYLAAGGLNEYAPRDHRWLWAMNSRASSNRWAPPCRTFFPASVVP